MASSHSLLGLVSQLQSMELSFTSILMEAAMKLSALTDANIFVLVETGEGRKFSGKRHLCDAYAAGLLAPTGSDVEFEINPSVSALQERREPADPLRRPATPAHHPSPQDPLANDFFAPPMLGGHRKRGRSLGLARFDGGKRARWWPSPERGRSARPGLEAPLLQEAPVFASTPFSEIDVKKERAPIAAENEENRSRRSGFEKSVADVGADGGIVPNDAVANRSCNGFDIPNDVSMDIIPWMNQPLEGRPDESHNGLASFASELCLSRLPPDAASGASAPSTLDLSKLDDALLMHVSADKLEALQTLPPREIFEKGTVGHRLLNSVMYEIGRSIAQTCAGLGLASPKDHESKIIFSACFDKWIADNLAHLANSDKRLENLSRSPLGFMKQNARVHFYKVMSSILKDKGK